MASGDAKQAVGLYRASQRREGGMGKRGHHDLWYWKYTSRREEGVGLNSENIEQERRSQQRLIEV